MLNLANQQGKGNERDGDLHHREEALVTSPNYFFYQTFKHHEQHPPPDTGLLAQPRLKLTYKAITPMLTILSTT